MRASEGRFGLITAAGAEPSPIGPESADEARRSPGPRAVSQAAVI